MGNLLNGVSSASENVGAKCRPRKIAAETQSLKPSPALSKGVCHLGTANAPSAITGVSFSNSRRFMRLNLSLSVFKAIKAAFARGFPGPKMRFRRGQKVSERLWYDS